jgi:CRP/FNR family transcriptional regulator
VGNVIEGVLKLSVSTVDGREQTLGLLFPSDFIGRPFGPTTNHSVVALTDAEVCTFRRTGFDEFARRHPDLEHGLLQRTLTELDRTRQWMALLGRKSATARVASFLLEMAGRARCLDAAEQESGACFELPLSRQDIADLLGLTIETVSRQITSLRDEGIIATPTRRTIDILDRERLVERAGEV